MGKLQAGTIMSGVLDVNGRGCQTMTRRGWEQNPSPRTPEAADMETKATKRGHAVAAEVQTSEGQNAKQGTAQSSTDGVWAQVTP